MPRIRTHPGEVLREEFMVPYGLSANALAKRIDVPANRISELVAGRRAITADTALRLERLFGSSASFWLRLQSAYDESVARTGHDYSSIEKYSAA